MANYLVQHGAAQAEADDRRSPATLGDELFSEPVRAFHARTRLRVWFRLATGMFQMFVNDL